jgi:hypothetical protein
MQHERNQMASINFTLKASISATAKLIRTIGATLTPIIFSEPGVGKTSLLGMLEQDLGTDEWDFIYVDCPVKDMMDIAASIPNHETRTLEYYVSSLFKLGNGKKKVIMLDEFAKAPKLLQVIFTRMMLERMIGDVALPEGSIVFGTSNNTTDGVGDAMLAHAGNRICKISMSKPTAEQWCSWAGKQATPIARPIRAWVAMTPKVMKSYTDGDQNDNPYIFNPKNTGQQFASPRSLAKAHVIVSNKDTLGEELMMTALAGTIGEAAARSMAAFISLEDKLMPMSEVLKNPSTCKVPDDVSVLLMMMMEAIDTLDNHEDLTSYMEFVNRIKAGELVQSIFFTMMMRNKPKLGSRNKEIQAWAAKNYVLLQD